MWTPFLSPQSECRPVYLNRSNAGYQSHSRTSHTPDFHSDILFKPKPWHQPSWGFVVFSSVHSHKFLGNTFIRPESSSHKLPFQILTHQPSCLQHYSMWYQVWRTTTHSQIIGLSAVWKHCNSNHAQRSMRIRWA